MKAAKDGFRDIELSPNAGTMDLRSPDGGVAPSDYRLVVNLTLNEERGRCRMGGWKQLFKDSEFGFLNQDFHDQLIGCQYYYYENEQTIVGIGSHGTTVISVTPSYTSAPYSADTNLGLYPGYGPDYYSFYPPIQPISGLWMNQMYNGYPYDPPYEGPFYPPYYYTYSSGPPYYYSIPYFQIAYATFFAPFPVAQTITGIGSVTGSPVITTSTLCTDLQVRKGCRESITMLGTVVSESQSRKLVLGTRNKLAVLNERQGNWRIIADGLGGAYETAECTCSPRRFTMARLGGYAFFTNNFDPVLQWRYEDPPGGCNLWSAEFVEDLIDLGITKAKCVASWQGFLIIANVEQEAVLRPFRIFWSDFNAPSSFIPGAESLAGFSDLSADEEILALVPLGNGLRVYTNLAIYAVSLVGGDEVLHFEKLYGGDKALRYSYGVANTGAVHYYMGESTIYALREFDREPQIVEWIHKAAGAIYSGVRSDWVKGFSSLAAFGPINKEQCDLAIGWYWEQSGEVFFSWPSEGADCPDKTLVINTQYGGAHLIDYGFTTALDYTSDPKMTVAEWLISLEACTWANFTGQMIKEGEPYSTTVGAFTDPPLYILNPTEDPDLPVSEDSLCARLSGTVDDLCRDCKTRSVLVLASASDKTLKEYDPEIAYRERFLDLGESYPCPLTVRGMYVRDGYTSLLQRDAHDYGRREEKLIRRVEVDYDAEAQTTPNQLYYQLGYASNAKCVTWQNVLSKDLRCITAKTEAEHAVAGTRPDLAATYQVYRRGTYLASRIFITGTGGLACMTRITERLKLAQGEWR